MPISERESWLRALRFQKPLCEGMEEYALRSVELTRPEN